jgi:hypothetical protein
MTTGYLTAQCRCIRNRSVMLIRPCIYLFGPLEHRARRWRSEFNWSAGLMRELLCIGALVLCMPAGAGANRVVTAPERAVRDFITALAMHDTQAFARAIRPDPRASRFINPRPLTPDEREEAARRLETLQVRPTDDVLLRGEPVKPDSQGDYPVGTAAHFVASGNGGPALVTLVREPAGWKVDMRWWLAMLDMANAPPPAAGSPDHTIRSLLLALIGLNRNEALRYAVPGADVNLLFAGAPSVREPSGVLEASAMEMPLVEVGTGEFYRLPSGRVVEGSTAADRKVFVGQFGPVEIPFVLRRVGNAWRVEAEPYFLLINR